MLFIAKMRQATPRAPTRASPKPGPLWLPMTKGTFLVPLAVHTWPLLTTRLLSVSVFLLAEWRWVIWSALTLPAGESGPAGGEDGIILMEVTCLKKRLATLHPIQAHPGNPGSMSPRRKQ